MSFLIDPFRTKPFYPAATLIFNGGQVGPTLSTVTTINNVPIGDEADDRRVIIVVEWGTSPQKLIQSATVGDVEASVDVSLLVDPDFDKVAIISCNVPTGITADVKITFPTIVTDGHIYISTYSAYGLVSGEPISTVYDADSITDASPQTRVIETKRGGILVAGFRCTSTNGSWEMASPSDDYVKFTENEGAFSSFVAGGMGVPDDEAAHEISLTCNPISPQAFQTQCVIASYR